MLQSLSNPTVCCLLGGTIQPSLSFRLEVSCCSVLGSAICLDLVEQKQSGPLGYMGFARVKRLFKSLVRMHTILLRAKTFKQGEIDRMLVFYSVARKYRYRVFCGTDRHLY